MVEMTLRRRSYVFSQDSKEEHVIVVMTKVMIYMSRVVRM